MQRYDDSDEEHSVPAVRKTSARATRSATRSSKRPIDVDDKLESKANGRSTKKQKSSKRRRRKKLDSDIEVVREAPLNTVSALRAAASKANAAKSVVEDDDDDDGNTALQASLRRARESMRQLRANAAARMERLVAQDEEDKAEESLEDVGGFDELEEFARNLDVDAGDAAKVAEEVALFAEQEERAVAVREAGSGPAVFASERRDEFGDAGVAAALARFRTMGELSRRGDQHGRARDKRVANDDDDGIRLNYSDEAGHELTPKEAFRLMCHKFHGKGPGKNKRETRLRQSLRNRKLKEMAADDTPLGGVSALREETRRTGVAHVVLSGNAATSSSAINEGLSKARRLQQ